MKKVVFGIALVTLMMLTACAISPRATLEQQAWEQANPQYTRAADFLWERRGNGVRITGYIGTATDVRIPTKIYGRPVIEIGTVREPRIWDATTGRGPRERGAFEGRRLTSVTSVPAGQRGRRAGGFVAAPPPPARFIGDRGSGIRIAIMPPEPIGLPEGRREQLPISMQGELIHNFARLENAGIRVENRLDLPAILMDAESGIYSPDADIPRLGELAGVDYFLMGDIRATPTGYILHLRVTGARSDTAGEIRASFLDTVTQPELDNFIGIRRASAYLLKQMGVTLTDVASRELARAPSPNEIRAEHLLARSMVAQDRGNEIEAIFLNAQAMAFNPQLTEAVARQNILEARIQTRNLGADVLQEIAWRATWMEWLRETGRFFDAHRGEAMPFTLFYTTEIQRGQINWANETVPISTIGANVSMAANSFLFGRHQHFRTAGQLAYGFGGFTGFAANYAENERQAGTYSFVLAGGWQGGAGADIGGLTGTIPPKMGEKYGAWNIVTRRYICSYNDSNDALICNAIASWRM